MRGDVTATGGEASIVASVARQVTLRSRCLVPFSPDGRTLYELTGEDTTERRVFSRFTLQLWDPVCGRLVQEPLLLGEITSGQTAAPGLSVSLDGRHIWVQTPDGRLTIVDSARLALSTGRFEGGARSLVSDGRRVFYIVDHTEIVEIPLSSLERALAQSVDNSPFERPTDEAQNLEITPPLQEEEIVGLALSPDAKQLYFGILGANADVSIRRFDLEHRQEIGEPITVTPVEDGNELSLSFAVSSDGTRLLVADGRSAQIGVFDLQSGSRDDDRSLTLDSNPVVLLAAPALADHVIAGITRNVPPFDAPTTFPTFRFWSLPLGLRAPLEWDVNDYRSSSSIARALSRRPKPIRLRSASSRPKEWRPWSTMRRSTRPSRNCKTPT